MKYKDEITITLTIIILVIFLKIINVFQIENKFGNPIIMILMILCCSFITILIQRNINNNYKMNKINYKNLDILKYLSAILIIILHLRPFLNFSAQLDLAFNNIITRVCVPIFLIITGYFVAKKERDNPNYIKDYIKKTIPLYIVWSVIYIPIIIYTIIQYQSIINDYLISLNISTPLLIVLLIFLIPILLIIAFIYTGTYYHLWYFPAIIFSLLLLKKWKKRINVKYLLILSFILLLFGATETYYGIFSISIKELLSYYYNIFFTTRNFLFFGLFYVVLGYFMGTKEKIYSKNCFVKLIVSIFFLIFESIVLHDTERLNSNILMSCVPLTYYLFISTIYITNNLKTTKLLSNLSKYYYLIHPMVIFIISLLFKQIIDYPYLNILLVLILTHILSLIIIKIKEHRK